METPSSGSARTQAGNHAIRGTEIGRAFSTTIEDEQLVLDERGFGHRRAGAAGTGDSGNGHQQMQKQDGQIAHRRILARSRHGQRMITNLGIRHAQLPGEGLAASRVTGALQHAHEIRHFLDYAKSFA